MQVCEYATLLDYSYHIMNAKTKRADYIVFETVLQTSNAITCSIMANVNCVSFLSSYQPFKTDVQMFRIH